MSDLALPLARDPAGLGPAPQPADAPGRTAHVPAAAGSDHPAVSWGRIGVLLINLGTPDATDFWSIRRYLREFLSDRRVIEVNRVLWTVLLYGIILNTRPRKTGHAYDQVWDRVRDESPLRGFTRDQSAGLMARLGDLGDVQGRPLVVDWAMRYGNPSIASRIQALHQAGCERILTIALYPQYCAATTASVYDTVFDALKALRWQPALRTAPAWPDDPAYLRALADSLVSHLATLEWEPERILLSYHGYPLRYLKAGDPYFCQCHKTSRLLAAHLATHHPGFPVERLVTTFQSRFGKDVWVEPFTDVTLERLPAAGVRRVAVITPGFVADCVETLEEIAMGGRDTFLAAGGTHYTVVPCLNATAGGLDVLESVIRRELAGWAGSPARR